MKKKKNKNEAQILLFKAGITYKDAQRLYGITAYQLKHDTLTDDQTLALIKHEERNHD